MDAAILAAYQPGLTSLRQVADKVGTDHHRVRRVLLKHGIQPEKARREFTEEHRRNISAACMGRSTWSKGKRMPKAIVYKNMAAHIRFDVTAEWLSQFDDIEKLKALNSAITRRQDRFDVDTDWYKAYVMRFYFCDQFNEIYRRWVDGGKDPYMRPSVDHINPRASGGCNKLENLQFLSWFENRCKNDMDQSQWDEMKANLRDYLL